MYEAPNGLFIDGAELRKHGGFRIFTPGVANEQGLAADPYSTPWHKSLPWDSMVGMGKAYVAGVPILNTAFGAYFLCVFETLCWPL